MFRSIRAIPSSTVCFKCATLIAAPIYSIFFSRFVPTVRNLPTSTCITTSIFIEENSWALNVTCYIHQLLFLPCLIIFCQLGMLKHSLFLSQLRLCTAPYSLSHCHTKLYNLDRILHHHLVSWLRLYSRNIFLSSQYFSWCALNEFNHPHASSFSVLFSTHLLKGLRSLFHYPTVFTFILLQVLAQCFIYTSYTNLLF